MVIPVYRLPLIPTVMWFLVYKKPQQTGLTTYSVSSIMLLLKKISSKLVAKVKILTTKLDI